MVSEIKLSVKGKESDSKEKGKNRSVGQWDSLYRAYSIYFKAAWSRALIKKYS